MKLPKHIHISIEHQPHAVVYCPVDEWLGREAEGGYLVDPEEMVRTGEVWTVRWYPDTPVGFHCVSASTLELALKAANECQ